ncbi:hypothetical protein CROQUDRAFT_105771 [Cronartium quercuum f. sp. fusiforme G11]|uniref:Uncharacterized protein n=1 Tax=Cronartium quercuum f. sp. fusiforme G11 TaxID=708437 RepID=A0A9P6NLT4_9BASI|nr:hypothetical protein CROQUDRAFT_105771 [Cronartium quercuum f. sp. fusiforme G11]
MLDVDESSDIDLADVSTLLSLAATEKASKMSLQKTVDLNLKVIATLRETINKAIPKLCYAKATVTIVIRAPPDSTPLAKWEASYGHGSEKANDVIFYTKTRTEACVLYKNKHLWTDKVDEERPTLPNQYPISLNGILVNFQPQNPKDLLNLVRENEIDVGVLQLAPQLIRPTQEDQRHGFIVPYFLDEVKIRRGGSFYKGTYYRG